MKLIKLSAILALALAMSFTSTGCKKKPTNVTPLPGQPTGKVGGGNTPLIDNTGGMGLGNNGGVDSTGGIGTTGLEEFEGMLKDPAALAAYTVHFAYDSSAVRSSEQGNVTSVASELNANPMNKVLIEGHCDERGTEEYNRALGERRALSLREALAKQGVSPDRVRTLSYGEDRPAVDGHDESAWSANRRGEFILLRPKM
jgi:peptidoglycan-associated lipoprotein